MLWRGAGGGGAPVGKNIVSCVCLFVCFFLFFFQLWCFFFGWFYMYLFFRLIIYSKTLKTHSFLDDAEFLHMSHDNKKTKTKKKKQKKKKNTQKKNEITVRQAKTQISLGISPVWSESSLCAQWVAKDPSLLHGMSRLIWVFAGRTAILMVLSCRGPFCFIPLDVCFFQFQTELNALELKWYHEYIKGDNSAFLQKWFKQIQSLFYCGWGSKVADLISLKFIVKLDHCPWLTLSFQSTKIYLSLAFYKGSNFMLRKRKWSK